MSEKKPKEDGSLDEQIQKAEAQAKKLRGKIKKNLKGKGDTTCE